MINELLDQLFGRSKRRKTVERRVRRRVKKRREIEDIWTTNPRDIKAYKEAGEAYAKMGREGYIE
jgi:hypothetical protein